MNISPGGWVALGCLAGVVILSGLVLWGAYLRGRQAPKQTPAPQDREGPSATRAWTNEDAAWAELSRRVADLKGDLHRKDDSKHD